MPIYEYRCNNCGHEMEAMQKLADDPLKDCPECAEPALKKLISPVGFRLKGSGWYETDFKTGDKKKNLAEGGEKSSSENKPAEGKSEKSDGAKKTESSGKSETKSSSGSGSGPSSSKAA
jgi:putative FmdB family regulatory protein